MSRHFIVGGAGFLGSHFVDRLLADERGEVTVFDNFSSGREWHLEQHDGDERLSVVRGDVKELAALSDAMRGHDVVIHLASNPDIARAATEPAIDFDEGTLLTHHVVEAMRITSTAQILYASGSGVYGDIGETESDEDFGPAGADLHLRRQQAGRRGPDLLLLPHVRPARLRVSLRQRRRAAPDARRRLRFRAPAARRPEAAADPRRRHPEQVLHPRRPT